ncbi:MAG: hypothetical protein M1832_001273 [Thelocarpon impressellum]|nr:MAG: hypothetical protein M1832_001273 [Thelocarpon impressellum]
MPSPKKQAIKWGPEADTRLFLAIISVHQIKPDYAKVAAILDTTSATIVQRMFKLRQKAKAIDAALAADAAPAAGLDGCQASSKRGGRAADVPAGTPERPKSTVHEAKTPSNSMSVGDQDASESSPPPLTPDSVSGGPPATPTRGARRVVPPIMPSSTASEKVTSGRIAKRASLRKPKHVDYRRLLEDPFLPIMDGDRLVDYATGHGATEHGEFIAVSSEGSEGGEGSEDSTDGDEDFVGGGDGVGMEVGVDD